MLALPHPQYFVCLLSKDNFFPMWPCRASQNPFRPIWCTLEANLGFSFSIFKKVSVCVLVDKNFCDVLMCSNCFDSTHALFFVTCYFTFCAIIHICSLFGLDSVIMLDPYFGIVSDQYHLQNVTLFVQDFVLKWLPEFQIWNYLHKNVILS